MGATGESDEGMRQSEGERWSQMGDWGWGSQMGEWGRRESF